VYVFFPHSDPRHPSSLFVCVTRQIASFKDEERTVTYSSALHYFDGFHEWKEEASCEVAVMLADDLKALIPMGNAIDNLIKVCIHEKKESRDQAPDAKMLCYFCYFPSWLLSLHLILALSSIKLFVRVYLYVNLFILYLLSALGIGTVAGSNRFYVPAVARLVARFFGQ
jgi:hypothetical protein